MLNPSHLTVLAGLVLSATCPALADDEAAGPLREAAPQAAQQQDNPPPPAAQQPDGQPAVEADAETAEEHSDTQTQEQTPEAAEPTERELRQQMRNLQRELNQAREELLDAQGLEQNDPQADSRAVVDQTFLPAEPTREECEAYLEALREAAEGRRSFSSRDPIVEKLRELPPWHMDLLVFEMTNGSSLRYYANYALRGVDPASMRERFVEMLDENPNMIGVIVTYGWVEDVRETVARHIVTADSSITPGWFQAGVELNDPELYEKLHELTVTSRYASRFLDMLRTLPDYDLEYTVRESWRHAVENQPHSSISRMLAPIAAEHGVVEALGVLIGHLASHNSFTFSSSSYNQQRINVLRLIEFRGTNDEIVAWFEENQDRLVFDHLHGRFVLPEAF